MVLPQTLEAFRAQGVRVDADARDPLALLVIIPEGLLEFAVNRDTMPGLVWCCHICRSPVFAAGAVV